MFNIDFRHEFIYASFVLHSLGPISELYFLSFGISPRISHSYPIVGSPISNLDPNLFVTHLKPGGKGRLQISQMNS